MEDIQESLDADTNIKVTGNILNGFFGDSERKRANLLKA